MRKRKLIISLGLIIVFLGLLHFVPIYSKSGYIDHTINGNATCIGYLGNQPHYYRLINNDLSEFNKDKAIFKLDVNTFNNTLCGIEPVTLRLYLL